MEIHRERCCALLDVRHDCGDTMLEITRDKLLHVGAQLWREYDDRNRSAYWK